uniref:Uncharacterized protein n=1 Tax=Mycena chlorophos TaxID=658473 RepID=A0ABQ0L7Q7_MYCCL|nr:predicted protein [Mycena chlorophos]
MDHAPSSRIKGALEALHWHCGDPMSFFAVIFALLLVPFVRSAFLGDIVARQSSSISLANSEWIWQDNYVYNSWIGLRKDFTPPLGKSLIAAEIVATVDVYFDFYVNGNYVGSGTPPARTRFSNRFCVDLEPSYNVFAFNASSTGGNGAMIATILLTYSDLTTDTIVSDASWRVSDAVAGFEQLSFDDTAWPAAVVRGVLGDAPWDDVNIPADPPVITFDRVDWIWTNAIPASGQIPAGSRAMRRTFAPFPGQVPASADIIISMDNDYTLWVNGIQIANGSGFATAHHYIVNFVSTPPPTEIVFAILGTNAAAGPAGLLFGAEINMVPSDRVGCIAGSFVVSDVVWVSTKGAIPTGWEQPGFDDSDWPPVVSEGTYPAAPWDTVKIGAAAPAINI